MGPNMSVSKSRNLEIWIVLNSKKNTQLNCIFALSMTNKHSFRWQNPFKKECFVVDHFKSKGGGGGAVTGQKSDPIFFVGTPENMQRAEEFQMRLSISLKGSVHPSIFLSVCPFVHPSVRLSVRMSVHNCFSKIAKKRQKEAKKTLWSHTDPITCPPALVS